MAIVPLLSLAAWEGYPRTASLTADECLDEYSLFPLRPRKSSAPGVHNDDKSLKEEHLFAAPEALAMWRAGVGLYAITSQARKVLPWVACPHPVCVLP